jgi:hypothetical protein
MPIIDRHHLDEAAAQGIVSLDQAERLWTFLSGRGGEPAREAPAAGGGFRFSFTTALYYLGGMLAVGAMGFFLELGQKRFGGWGVLAISVAYLVITIALAVRFEARGLVLPMVLLAGLAVVLVPVGVWGLQRALHIPVGQHPLLLELGAVAAAAAVFFRFQAPALLLPLAATLWLTGMDLATMLLPADAKPGSSQEQALRQWYSVGSGILMLATAFWIDLRARPARDYAFWLYLSGLASAWGGLTLMDASSVAGTLAYLAVNAGLMLLGAALLRRAFTVFGAVGVAIGLASLGNRFLKDSWLFPVALTLIGLGVVGFGLWWSRNEARLSSRLQAVLPAGLREAIASRRSVL